MSKAELQTTLSPNHRRLLEHAVRRLESQDFAGRLADYAGQPVTHAFRLAPRVATAQFNRVVEGAILNCLDVAIKSIKPQSRRPPANRVSSMLVGVTGGVSGFFGFTALPLELPVTTTLMLRSIADIARHHGEDLSTLEARLACVEVFALGAPRNGRRADFGYYASRALLNRLASDASTALAERAASNVAAPVVGGFVTEVATRFGLVVSERTAASAVPVLGALGGATVNVIFMSHFQKVAQGHFAIRRLERHYGEALIRGHYAELAQSVVKPGRGLTRPNRRRAPGA